MNIGAGLIVRACHTNQGTSVSSPIPRYGSGQQTRTSPFRRIQGKAGPVPNWQVPIGECTAQNPEAAQAGNNIMEAAENRFNKKPCGIGPTGSPQGRSGPAESSVHSQCFYRPQRKCMGIEPTGRMLACHPTVLKTAARTSEASTSKGRALARRLSAQF